MEDTKSLLMMVLHKIFHNQPKTIENTFQLIHSFNNGKIEKKNYEKTLKTICDLMNDELPSPILVYILTLVDMPQDFDSQSPVVEKMRRTHDFLPEINVRPHLLEYLNNIKPSNNNNTNKTKNHSSNVIDIIAKNEDSTENKTKTRLRRSRKLLHKNTGHPEKLLDICAIYIVKNETFLKSIYKQKQAKAWHLINSNSFSGKNLKQCYSVVTDLNKKMKWLRAIESDDISHDLLMDEYKNSDAIFLQEHNFQCGDPFELSPECEKAIFSS